MGAPPPPPPPPQGPGGWPPPPPQQPPPPPGWGQQPFAPQPPRRPGTDGFAIASLVLGLVGGSILAIIFGFVAKSRIKKSGAAGGGLATAGIILGFVWLALCGGFIALGLSGVLDSKNSDDFTGEKKAVAQTVDDVEQALDDDDASRACNDLFTEDFRNAPRTGGKSCVEALGGDDDDADFQAEIDIRTITIIAGQRAIVRLDEGGTDEKWTLLKQDRWRVDDIVTE